MNHPTPALLAESLSNSSNVTLSSLVEIRKTGNLPPLFMVPGSGGTLLPFEHLIDQLPKNRPLYGFVHPRLRGNKVECTTIHDLASFYVQCMEQEVTAKTVYVVGHCFGGAVAYEMCQVLSKKGVNAVPVILDTPVPQKRTRKLEAAGWNYGQWTAIVGEVLAENAGHPISIMKHMTKMKDEKALNFLKDTLVKEGLYGAHNDVNHLKAIVDMLRELDLSFIHYTPQKTGNNIYLLRAKQMTKMDKLGILASGKNSKHWGWEDIAHNICAKDVNGDHNTMLDKANVSDIVDFLINCFSINDTVCEQHNSDALVE